MRHMWKINAQKGFTLLEMLVAVTLIAIGLLATAAMQTVALNSNSIANRSSVVTAIAQEVMEEIMSRDPVTDPQLRAHPGLPLVLDYDLSPGNLATMDRNIPSAGTFHASVTTRHPSVDVTSVEVTVTRIDVITNKGLTGVRGLGAGGAFMLTDLKQVPGMPKDP